MNTKTWLRRARKQSREIDALLECKQQTYDTATSATAALSNVFTGTGGKLSPDGKFVSYAALSAEVDGAIDELVSIKAEIIQAIRQVPDTTLRALLIEYYVNGKTWEEVADAIHYSYSQTVKYLHPKALHLLENATECHSMPQTNDI